jgi:ribosomal protein L21
MKAQETKVSPGEVIEVENQNPKPAANKKYNAVLLIVNGEKHIGLATGHMIKDMLDRAQKNPEDCPEESFRSK